MQSRLRAADCEIRVKPAGGVYGLGVGHRHCEHTCESDCGGQDRAAHGRHTLERTSGAAQGLRADSVPAGDQGARAAPNRRKPCGEFFILKIDRDGPIWAGLAGFVSHGSPSSQMVVAADDPGEGKTEQFQGDHEGTGAPPLNSVECDRYHHCVAFRWRVRRVLGAPTSLFRSC
jgi:hypothetical protein